MYASFDEIGSKNQYSWNYGEKPKTAEFIGSISKRNRIICDPCKFFRQKKQCMMS